MSISNALNKRLAFALKTATDLMTSSPAGSAAYINQQMLDSNNRARAYSQRMQRQQQEAALAADRERFKDWFDATPVNNEHPLKPIQVWDPYVPQELNPKYKGFRGAIRKYFSRGPGTTAYDTSRYKPNGPGDYIIGFGGAGSGVEGRNGNFPSHNKIYGAGNTAWFTWDQLNDAENYMRSLPKGSRIHLYGHSMGGHAALKFAERANQLGIPIAGLDLRDPVRMDGRIRSIFQKLLGERTKMTVPPNVQKSTNIYKPNLVNTPFTKKWDTGDLVSFVGQRIKELGNTFNIKKPNMGHTDIAAADNTINFPVEKNR